MRNLGILIACLLLLASTVDAAGDTGRWLSVLVTRVIDGDTFVLEYKGEDRCRMLGYNAPEKKEDSALYGMARVRLISLFELDGNRIYIFTEKRDKYNRMLCKAFLKDGTDVNMLMRSWLEKKGYKGVGKYEWMEGK